MIRCLLPKPKDKKTLLLYHSKLTLNARKLRQKLTDSEQSLWYHLRRKQLLGIQFYRQKPIGTYIVDFYAPAVKLVVELDGSQHYEKKHQLYDEKRTIFLQQQGLSVLRFSNLDVLRNTDGVLSVILQRMKQYLTKKHNDTM